MNRGYRVGWKLSVLFCGVALAATHGTAAQGIQPKGTSMSYREEKTFLAQHTQVVELTDASGARVAICPQWQGRVMTSTCAGMDGPSFGFINREFIEKGESNPHINNYGGEERMWLAPEGGQFSLWFQPGAAQNLDNWFTPPAFNEGSWPQSPNGPENTVCMTKKMKLENTSATTFELEVTREVRLLAAEDLQKLFGATAAALMAGPDVKRVAYETSNQVTNANGPMTREKGLVAVWILGMMNAGPQTVIMVPYRSGPEAELGPVVKSDYFGSVPPDRLKITPAAILFRGDGHYRAKLGTSQRRAKNVLGSIDFAGQVLTLVQFSMPENPTQHDYVNSMWEVPQKAPYRGDVANTYNDGPPAPGKKGLGPFYEIESLSPAAPLASGQALVHYHRTVHVQAALPVLAKLAREVLGVDLEAVQQQMLSQ
jgi:hypothetical protein